MGSIENTKFLQLKKDWFLVVGIGVLNKIFNFMKVLCVLVGCFAKIIRGTMQARPALITNLGKKYNYL